MDDLLEPLRKLFGFDGFRPGQERIIRSLLAGRDVLGILPTGAGKSLTYQLTSQLLPGVTLVISPLIALMKDQAESLHARGIGVGVISSVEGSVEISEALAGARTGTTKLLYVTPERLENADFLAEARSMGISLIVVDEAHSISEWGQSFRTAYLNLAEGIRQLGRPTVLALTATATPWVRDDIVSGLQLRDPDLVVRGTFRSNLFLEVRRVESETEDRHVLRALLTGDDPLTGSGIIYVATTRAAQDTAGWLAEWGISADFYHGQRRKADRDRVQDGFMTGKVQVIAATNAFGLGVDKPDIRFVVHRDVPSSLERYYQEAGRAGRDGDPSRCVLIFRPGDLGRAAFLSGGGELTRDEVVRAYHGFAQLPNSPVTLGELQRASGLGRGDFTRLVPLLEERGVLKRSRRQFQVAEFDPEEIPLEREAARRAYERSRLEMMRTYAELRDCRWRYIMNYFGEEPDWTHCGLCDVDTASASSSGREASRSGREECRSERGESSSGGDESASGRQPSSASASAGNAGRQQAATRQPFAVNDWVVHVSLGEGVVQRVTSESLTVLFEDSGYKTFDLAMIVEQALVRRL